MIISEPLVQDRQDQLLDACRHRARSQVSLGLYLAHERLGLLELLTASLIVLNVVTTIVGGGFFGFRNQRGGLGLFALRERGCWTSGLLHGCRSQGGGRFRPVE